MSDICLIEWHLMKWCMLQEKSAVTFPQDMRGQRRTAMFFHAFLSAPPQNLLTGSGAVYKFTFIFTPLKC